MNTPNVHDAPRSATTPATEQLIQRHLLEFAIEQAKTEGTDPALLLACVDGDRMRVCRTSTGGRFDEWRQLQSFVRQARGLALEHAADAVAVTLPIRLSGTEAGHLLTRIEITGSGLAHEWIAPLDALDRPEWQSPPGVLGAAPLILRWEPRAA